MKKLLVAGIMVIVALAGFAQTDSSSTLTLRFQLALEARELRKIFPFQTHYPYLMDNLDSWIAIFQKAIKQKDRLEVFISFGTDTLYNAMLLGDVEKNAPIVMIGKVWRVVQTSNSKTHWIVEIRPTFKYFQDIDRIEWGLGNTNTEVDVEFSSETRPKILEGEVILVFGTFWGNQTYNHRQTPVILGMFYATEHKRQNIEKN
jgi:hypothetical protein